MKFAAWRSITLSCATCSPEGGSNALQDRAAGAELLSPTNRCLIIKIAEEEGRARDLFQNLGNLPTTPPNDPVSPVVDILDPAIARKDRFHYF